MFKVSASAEGGRITATEYQLLCGKLGRGTWRTHESAIDTALRDTYECPGQHGFEQEFRVRVE